MEPTEECEEDGIPAPPTRDLGAYALLIYQRYYQELESNGFTPIDLIMLEDFAYACDRIRANQESLEGEGAVQPGKHGPVTNPRVAVIQKLEATKKTLSQQLGIGALAKKQMNKLDRVAKSEKKKKNTPNLNLFRNNGRVDNN